MAPLADDAFEWSDDTMGLVVRAGRLGVRDVVRMALVQCVRSLQAPDARACCCSQMRYRPVSRKWYHAMSLADVWALLLSARFPSAAPLLAVGCRPASPQQEEGKLLPEAHTAEQASEARTVCRTWLQLVPHASSGDAEPDTLLLHREVGTVLVLKEEGVRLRPRWNASWYEVVCSSSATTVSLCECPCAPTMDADMQLRVSDHAPATRGDARVTTVNVAEEAAGMHEERGRGGAGEGECRRSLALRSNADGYQGIAEGWLSGGWRAETGGVGLIDSGGWAVNGVDDGSVAAVGGGGGSGVRGAPVGVGSQAAPPSARSGGARRLGGLMLEGGPGSFSLALGDEGFVVCPRTVRTLLSGCGDAGGGDVGEAGGGADAREGVPAAGAEDGVPKVLLVDRGQIGWLDARAWHAMRKVGDGAPSASGGGCGAGGRSESAPGRRVDAERVAQHSSDGERTCDHPKDIYRRLYFAELLNCWLPNLRWVLGYAPCLKVGSVCGIEKTWQQHSEDLGCSLAQVSARHAHMPDVAAGLAKRFAEDAARHSAPPHLRPNISTRPLHAISGEEAFLLYHTISSSGPPNGIGSMPWRWGGGSRMAGEEDGLSQLDGPGAGMGGRDEGGSAGQGAHTKECAWAAVPALVVGGVKYHVIFADGMCMAGVSTGGGQIVCALTSRVLLVFTSGEIDAGNAGQGRVDPAEDTDADFSDEGGMGSGVGAEEEQGGESGIPRDFPSNAAATAAEDGEEENAAVGEGRASTSIFARMLERSQKSAAVVGVPAAPATRMPGAAEGVAAAHGAALASVEVEEGGAGVVERPHDGGSASIFGRMLERAEQRAAEAAAAPAAEVVADTEARDGGDEAAGEAAGGRGAGGQSLSSSVFGRMVDVCVERAAAAAAARRAEHAGACGTGAVPARGGEYVDDDSDRSDEEPLPMPITRWRMDMGAWCSQQEWVEAREVRGRSLSKVGRLNESLVAVYCLAQYLSIAGL